MQFSTIHQTCQLLNSKIQCFQDIPNGRDEKHETDIQQTNKEYIDVTLDDLEVCTYNNVMYITINIMYYNIYYLH